METIIYGAFGEVKDLENARGSFLSMVELYDTAEQRGHKIEHFWRPSTLDHVGVGYYAVKKN